MDVTHDKVSIEMLDDDPMGPNLVCEGAGEGFKECLGTTVCR